MEVGQSIRPTTLLALREDSELVAAPETLSVVYTDAFGAESREIP